MSTSAAPFALERIPLERVLGRPEHEIPLEQPLSRLADERILVTGAGGSIGRALVDALELGGLSPLATEIDTYDVRYPLIRQQQFPSVVFHLAGAKHAPDGELDPWAVCETNTIGTRNVLELGGRVILASTCKAADPETAYGASKLIAERMVLNAGGSVARFYNVVESSGNVFELWRQTQAPEGIPVTDCYRYFISLREAVALLLWCAVLPSGRYTIGSLTPRYMPTVASDLYPDRWLNAIEPRRGDRELEPSCGAAEYFEPTPIPPIARITSPHDA